MGSGFIAFDSQTIITNYQVIEGITKVVGVNEYGTEVTITDLTNYDVERLCLMKRFICRYLLQHLPEAVVEYSLIKVVR